MNLPRASVDRPVLTTMVTLMVVVLGAVSLDRLRIDLLLATPALLPRVSAVEIDRDYRKKKDGLTASDHAPVILELT